MSSTSSSSSIAGANPNIVSGLVSGMDWTNTVNELIANERQGMEGPLDAEQTANENQLTALSTINTNLTSLQGVLAKLNGPTSSWYQQTVAFAKTTATTTSNLSATTDGTTPLGQYTFNITQLATPTSIQGTAVAQPLSSSALSQTLDNLSIAVPINFNATDVNDNDYGEFTINGAQVSIYPTDTLQDVFNKISSATGGAVTASLSNNQVTLTGNAVNGNPAPDITVGSAGDTTNFLQAMELYTPTTPATTVSSTGGLGALNINTALLNTVNTNDLTGLTNGEGSFTVNGETIDYNVNTDSVQSLMNDIDQSGAGVLVQYDPGTGKLSITNTEGGSTGIALSDSTGLLTQLGLTSTAGATTSYGLNCQFSVNGGSTLTSNSNTITPDLSGVEGLTVTATNTGQDTGTVSNNTTNATSLITQLISSFNTFNDGVTAATKTTINPDGTVTTSTLTGNDEVEGWQSDISDMLFHTVNTGVSTVSALYQIGLDFNTTTGDLSVVDQTELDDALSNNPDAVAAIFNSPSSGAGPSGTGGIGNLIYNYINNITSSSGDIATEEASLNSEDDDIETKLQADETQISNDQANLIQGFQNMETDMAQSNHNLSLIQGLTVGG